MEGEGRVTRLHLAHQRCFPGAPPQWSLPFWGPLVLAQILPEEKQHSPERVLETTQGSTKVSFRMTASTVRNSGQSSFPFLERTSTGSPSECERFPPTGETHGALAGQDSVPRGTSQGRAWRMKKRRDWTGGYRFRHHNSCGTKEKKMTSRYRSAHCACAKLKKRKAKESLEPWPPALRVYLLPTVLSVLRCWVMVKSRTCCRTSSRDYFCCRFWGTERLFLQNWCPKTIILCLWGQF